MTVTKKNMLSALREVSAHLTPAGKQYLSAAEEEMRKHGRLSSGAVRALQNTYTKLFGSLRSLRKGQARMVLRARS